MPISGREVAEYAFKYIPGTGTYNMKVPCPLIIMPPSGIVQCVETICMKTIIFIIIIMIINSMRLVNVDPFLSVPTFSRAVKGVHLCIAQLFTKRNERRKWSLGRNNLLCFVIMTCFIYSADQTGAEQQVKLNQKRESKHNDTQY